MSEYGESSGAVKAGCEHGYAFNCPKCARELNALTVEARQVQVRRGNGRKAKAPRNAQRGIKAFKLSPEELSARYGLDLTPKSPTELLAQSSADSYQGFSSLHPNLGWENDQGLSRKANTGRSVVTQVSSGLVRLDRTNAARGEIARSNKVLGYKAG